jgi:hypothetical protein
LIDVCVGCGRAGVAENAYTIVTLASGRLQLARTALRLGHASAPDFTELATGMLLPSCVRMQWNVEAGRLGSGWYVAQTIDCSPRSVLR